MTHVASGTQGENRHTGTASLEVREPLVVAVVLNWNGWRDTIQCLESLAQVEYRHCEPVVVDNGSTDGSEREIRARFPELAMLVLGTNRGFAGGNNIGISYALERGADYVWLLNNDTRVEPNALAALVRTAESDVRVGIVGSVLENADGTLQAWGGGAVNVPLGLASVRKEPVTDGVAYVSGASMLVRRELLEDVGPLDESYFFFMEDVDLCYTAQQRGWKVAVASDSRVRHKGGASVGRVEQGRSDARDRFHVRASAVFIGKHGGRGFVPFALFRLAVIVLRRLYRRQLHRIPSLVAAFVGGLRIGVQGRRR